MNDDYKVAISVLKIFMAFEVVLCHFWTINIKTDGILGMFYFLKRIAAPTFMIISFYVCERRIAFFDLAYLKRRALQLYSPNAFWAIIYFVILWMGQYFNNSFSCHITDLFWQLLFGCSKPLNGQMWFSIDLIILTFFFAIMYKILRRKFAYIMCFCIAFSFVLQYSNINYKLWGGWNMRYVFHLAE
ncbi:MAG: acyltransferase [Lachnospiraceae bacterium]|nr:acyltransferase [Lachnospiraceae bacterium]